MFQVLAELHISMSSSSDVEVALHLVAVQTAEYPARVRRSPDPRRLGELLLLLLVQVVVHLEVVHLPLLPNALVQLVNTLLGVLSRPLRPACRILSQQVAGERAITRGILHIDVQVGTAHGDNDIEVDLHFVRNTLFDREGLRRCSGEPARGFGPGEPDACEDERDGPGGGIAALDKVGLLRFGCLD